MEKQKKTCNNSGSHVAKMKDAFKKKQKPTDRSIDQSMYVNVCM